MQKLRISTYLALLDNADRVVLLTEKERPRGRKVDISLTFLLPHE